MASLNRVLHRSLAGASLLATAAGIGACGDGAARGSGRSATLVVSAAASLKVPLERYALQLRRSGGVSVRYSFAGSDLLAAQIEEGLRPDVFASANLKLPRRLHASGLAEAPIAFGGNRLVLAVPRGSSKVDALNDLAKRRVALCVGSATVPIGEYTRKFMAGLPPRLAAAARAEIRDEEPDVSGIVGKLSEGAVDAGFLYASDVTSASGSLRAIPIPADLAPTIVYAASVVRGTGQPARAKAFIAALVNGAGRRDLAEAGFLPPP